MVGAIKQEHAARCGGGSNSSSERGGEKSSGGDGGRNRCMQRARGPDRARESGVLWQLPLKFHMSAMRNAQGQAHSQGSDRFSTGTTHLQQDMQELAAGSWLALYQPGSTRVHQSPLTGVRQMTFRTYTSMTSAMCQSQGHSQALQIYLNSIQSTHRGQTGSPPGCPSCMAAPACTRWGCCQLPMPPAASARQAGAQRLHSRQQQQQQAQEACFGDDVLLHLHTGF